MESSHWTYRGEAEEDAAKAKARAQHDVSSFWMDGFLTGWEVGWFACGLAAGGVDGWLAAAAAEEGPAEAVVEAPEEDANDDEQPTEEVAPKEKVPSEKEPAEASAEAEAPNDEANDEAKSAQAQMRFLHHAKKVPWGKSTMKVRWRKGKRLHALGKRALMANKLAAEPAAAVVEAPDEKAKANADEQPADEVEAPNDEAQPEEEPTDWFVAVD